MDPDKTSKSSVAAWCLYDFANSAFPVVVTTFVFATYFIQKIAVNPVIGTHQWGNALAFAGIMIAILSPCLGAIADYRGRRKPWLAFFSTCTLFSAGLLWFVKPSVNAVPLTLTLIIIGSIGFETSTVFYNAMLKNLVPKHYLGRLSGWGWGSGYAGGLICLVIALALVQNHFPVRSCAILVALWIFIFAQPLFWLTPDQPKVQRGIQETVRQGLSTLWQTLCSLPRHRTLLLFLISQMIYMDGMKTLFVFGGIYAATIFHFPTTSIIQFGIAMNVAAGLGAVGFAWVDDYLGAKPTILIALFSMIGTGIGLLLTHQVDWFWGFALIFGLFVGPVQAASRSFLVRLIPAEQATEMFGLYTFSGRVTTFAGPWLVGFLTFATGSLRIGLVPVFVFLLIGGCLLFCVNNVRDNERALPIDRSVLP